MFCIHLCLWICHFQANNNCLELSSCVAHRMEWLLTNMGDFEVSPCVVRREVSVLVKKGHNLWTSQVSMMTIANQSTSWTRKCQEQARLWKQMNARHLRTKMGQNLGTSKVCMTKTRNQPMAWTRQCWKPSKLRKQIKSSHIWMKKGNFMSIARTLKVSMLK